MSSSLAFRSVKFHQIREDYKIKIYKLIPAKFRSTIHGYIKENFIHKVPIICCQLIVPYLYLLEGMPPFLESICQLLNKENMNQAEITLQCLIAILQDNTDTNSHWTLPIFTLLSSMSLYCRILIILLSIISNYFISRKSQAVIIQIGSFNTGPMS